MAELCRFGDNEALRCILSATKIRGMSDLLISGETETKDATQGSQQYVQRKNGKPISVCFSVTLSGFTGCSTRSELADLITAARDGKEEYLYVGGQKLVPCKLMLVKAEASDFVLTPKGEIAHCVVSLTFNQSSGNDGAVTSSSKSSGSSSTKTTSSGTQYTVYAPGRGTQTVTATSVENAIRIAMQGQTAEYYTVNGKRYTEADFKKSTSTSTTGMAAKLATAAKAAATAKKSSATTQKQATASLTSRVIPAAAKKAIASLNIK